MNEFSTFEEYLWTEAEEMVDERFKWNEHKTIKYKSNFYKGIPGSKDLIV